ncbi:MAG: PEGA domain-containing protein [Prevotellaceae bacterium]|jgi:hypothetical protein|nr:PEGA domain-containing protein [Prevotellaceae bacterium]
MNKYLIILFAMLFFGFNANGQKAKKITVTPTEAKIYIDGNYVGDGAFSIKFGRKDDFFAVKLEHPGYVTKEVKIFRNDTRNVIAFDLKEDDALEGSITSNLSNQYFTIQVRDGVDENQAWKLLTQVLLNYFDEIKTSDKSSGFINTAWSGQSFPMAEVKVRTRIQIKEITNEGLAYQIRISSEIAPLNSGEQSYKPWPRVLKKYEPLISEMQQRIGKN